MGKRLEPERIPDTLRGFEGKWVAMVGDDVVTAAHNPRELVASLHEMGPRGAKAVTRFVPLPSDVIVIGVGQYNVRKFPYREEGSPAVLRPTLDIELRFGHGTFRTRALIDTGAPITVFDYATAEALLVRFGHAGAETCTVALLGEKRHVQFEYVDLSLVEDSASCWAARVGFITDPTFVMSFQGLLGTDGFLDKWAVTFNKYYDYFVLQQPDDAPG